MRTLQRSLLCLVQMAWLGGCAEDHDVEPGRALPPGCLSHDDRQDASPMSDEDAGARDSGSEGGPVVLAVPADQAAPPEVECPTSVAAVYVFRAEDLAGYQGVQCVSGPVWISVAVEDLSPLSQLRRAGSLHTEGTAALQQLSSLVRVDRDVDLRAAAPGVEGMRVPALRWVGGKLSVSGQLAEAGAFPALEYVGGDVVLPSVVPDATDTFPLLANVGGSVTLDQVPLRVLERIGRDLVIAGPGVGLASLQKLRIVGGSVRVHGTGIADILSLPGLERINGIFELSENPELSRIDLPKLSHLGSVDIRLNPQLSRCTIDTLLQRVHLDDAGEVHDNLDCHSCADSVCVAR